MHTACCIALYRCIALHTARDRARALYCLIQRCIAAELAVEGWAVDSASMADRGWSDHAPDVCLTFTMVTITSLTKLGLMGAHYTLPSLHLTMRTIVCAVVPVLYVL